MIPFMYEADDKTPGADFMSLSQSQIAEFLSATTPFNELSQADLLAISSKARECRYARGETIFNEGDLADSVWVLFEGRIQIIKYNSQAKPFALESVVPKELFGTLCRLGGGGRKYPCTAVAAGPVTALKILDHTFLEYYGKNPGMVRGVCSLCSARLKDVQSLRCVGQESAGVRIGNILARLYQTHGETIPFTKKELAELSGTTTETAFRTLHQFEKKGILKSLRGKIKVLKPSDLEVPL